MLSSVHYHDLLRLASDGRGGQADGNSGPPPWNPRPTLELLRAEAAALLGPDAPSSAPEAAQPTEAAAK